MSGDDSSVDICRCDFCGETERAGGISKGYRIRLNSEQTKYLCLCPVARRGIEVHLGLVVTGLAGQEVSTDAE